MVQYILVASGIGSKRGCLFRVDVYHPDRNKWGTGIQTTHGLFAMMVVKDQLLIAGGKRTTNNVTDEILFLWVIVESMEAVQQLASTEVGC